MQTNLSDITFIIIAGSILFLLLILFVVMFMLAFQKRRIKYQQEKTALKTAYDQEILKSQIEVQNQTLQHIGRELHDNIGQLLSVAKINLNVLEESNNSEHEYIKETHEIISQSINDLRALTKSLDGDFIKDFGLEESISHELQRIRKTKRFETQISVLGTKRALGYEIEIVLFRIVQEILNNALKHSKAKNIIVIFHYFPSTFKLSVKDDGNGFDLENIQAKSMKSAGAGLRNMHQRMELIGGKCNIKSVVNEGTEILLEAEK